MSQRGKFIVVDGGDGTGKTSVLEYLKQELKNSNVVFTREPGGTPLAEEIRSLFLKKNSERIFAETELMLVSASRLQHVGNFVLPTLREGTHTITDRFSPSTFAYQLCGNGRLDLSGLFQTLNTIAVYKLMPDLYVLLDVDPDVALARRREASGTDLTRFDEKEIGFHRLVREGFLETAQWYPHTVIVDAGQTQEKVRRTVLSEVKKCIGV